MNTQHRSGETENRLAPFSLLVKPASADCNLRCTYCFYLEKCSLYPEERRHRMSEETLERLISSYMATEQPVYSFGWQGGEPTLMGIEFFRKVTALQEKYGRSGAVVSNGLQTNATRIDNELAKHLRRYRFLVGVSLDGPEDLHDLNRRNVGGKGSHKSVLNGIEALRRHGVEFNVLVLVNAANVKKPLEVYNYLKDLGIFYHQYIPCVEFDEKGQKMPFAITGEEWGSFLSAIFAQWYAKDLNRVSVRHFDSVLEYLVSGRYNVCSMGRSCDQYFVVEHNGDVYPCDFFVEPEMKLGNILHDSWSDFRSSPVLREFSRQKTRWNPKCASCRFLPLCSGDCPKNRFSGTRDPRQLSWLCDGWTAFYETALPGFERLAAHIRNTR